MEEFNLNEIVKVEQLPKVFEQLELVGKFIEKKLEGVEDLTCTEENKQDVKDRRTEINNTLKILEDKRKEIKKQINEPYDLFNKKYEETIKVKLEDASKVLTDKITKIEDEQKLKKERLIRDYFEEYKVSKNVDFITFENIGLNITLAASEKSLKEQAKSFVDKVEDDLKLIDSQEYKEEILIEYKKTLNVSNSITMVVDRHKELNELKEKQEEIKNQKGLEEQNIVEVNSVLSAPTKEVEKEILELSFKVRGTKEELKELVSYLKERGYEYEQC